MVEFTKSLIRSIGYPGIALLMFIENVFPPIPSEVIMPFAGFVAEDGDLSFVGVVIAGTVGSVLGALPLYYLGHRVGKDRLMDWADAHGRWIMLTSDDIERAQSWFERHGAAAVFFCRLVPGVRSLISIPAGTGRMGLTKFLLLSTPGTALWSGLLAYLGGMLGRNYDRVEAYIGPASYVVIGGLVLWYLVHVIRHRKQVA